MPTQNSLRRPYLIIILLSLISLLFLLAACSEASRDSLVEVDATATTKPNAASSTPTAEVESSSQEAPAPALDVSQAELAALQTELEAYIEQRIKNDELVRSNGYVYAIDLAQLQIYFANQDNLASYSYFRNLALKNLLIDDQSDPYTQGFIAWRYQDGQAPDASGTTEALWVAKGFWDGFEQFHDAADEEVALLVLDGYQKHGFVDQDVWLIRNYFNFGTRAFASNSYLVDYYPDFVQQVATTTNNSDLKDVASQSLTLVRDSQSAAGLLHSLILPEIKTLYPDLNTVIFSPNDIVQLSNACFVAETVIQSDPDIGRNLLAFVEENLDDLKIYYYGRTGEAASEESAKISEWTCLVRLAASLDNPELVSKLMNHAWPFWQQFIDTPRGSPLYTAGQILLTLEVLQDK